MFYSTVHTPNILRQLLIPFYIRVPDTYHVVNISHGHEKSNHLLKPYKYLQNFKSKKIKYTAPKVTILL